MSRLEVITLKSWSSVVLEKKFGAVSEKSVVLQFNTITPILKPFSFAAVDLQQPSELHVSTFKNIHHKFSYSLIDKVPLIVIFFLLIFNVSRFSFKLF